MQWWDALILGVVEGLTEFLPISSTGHLILAGHVLGLSGPAVETFEVFIQLGAILAVVWLYRQRFQRLLQWNTPPESGFGGRQGWLLLGITSLPAVILGLLTHKAIKLYLFNPTTVAWALALGGVVLIVIDRLRPQSTIDTVDALTPKHALIIGLFQCLSLWPGVSRAGATIVGGLCTGLDRKLAAEYSFMAAVPIMFMATGYDLLKSWDQLQPSDVSLFAIGFGVAFISAILAIKGFIQLLHRVSFVPFGVYRIVLAALVLWFLGQGYPCQG